MSTSATDSRVKAVTITNNIWAASCILALALACIDWFLVNHDDSSALQVSPLLWRAPEYRLDPRDFETWYEEERAEKHHINKGGRAHKEKKNSGTEEAYRPSYEADTVSMFPLAAMILIENPHIYITFILKGLDVWRLQQHGENSNTNLAVRCVLPMVIMWVLGTVIFMVHADAFLAILTYLCVMHNIAQCTSIQRAAHEAAVTTDPTMDDGELQLRLLATKIVTWCPVLLWLTEADRGLDWFHFDTPHLFSLPPALAPLIVFVWGICVLLVVVKLCFTFLAKSDGSNGAASLRRLNLKSWVIVLLCAATWAAGLHTENHDAASTLLVLPHAAPSLVFAILELHSVLKTSSSKWKCICILGILLGWSFIEHFWVAEIEGPDSHPWRLLFVYALPQLLHIMSDQLCKF